MRVLWLTNDLPPRAGGIEQFVANLLARVHPATTVVVGPAQEGATAYDAGVPWRTVRASGRVLPTPATVRLVREVAGEHRPDVIVLGATWPLGELAGTLGRDPGVPVVGLSHGLEAGLVDVGLGRLVRRATRHLAAVTTISDFTEARLSSHLAAERVVRIPPGVDVEAFRPTGDDAGLRSRWGVPADAPVVGCISRLVRRKGQDTLLAAWPDVLADHPDAWLVLAGTGPLAAELRERAAATPQVVLPGRLAWDDLAGAYRSLDVFAMPCRTRLAGTDVEGLGIVYLEAQACGVPVVAGRSGGAPEAVVEGRTGLVVDGRDPAEVASSVTGLLDDPGRRRAMGAAGRAWVEERWSWEVIADRFAALLDDVVSGGRG